MTDFSGAIEDLELIDPPLLGGMFTWDRGNNQVVASRLDRFLVSTEWDEKFSNIKQVMLPRLTSDHCPLQLECNDWERKSSYFKFASWWLDVDGFTETVKEWWDSFKVEGRPDYILATKLKLLKSKLKEWSKEERGNLNKRKGELINKATFFDRLREQRTLTDDKMLEKANLAMDFEELANHEESAWRQKSRVLWLNLGDKNTKYFQRIANAHRRANTIDQLEVNGDIITVAYSIKDSILRFYQNLYSEAEKWRPGFSYPNFPTITEEEQAWLERNFEEEEILHGLKLCAADKAPGPDGFSMGFFHRCWATVKEDMMSTMQNFHSQSYFEKSFNVTYVALIPKKIGAKELKDFRPISLIGSVYKVISKVLTERLKMAMGKLVSKQQMVFLKGRQILDATLIANECVDTKLREQEAGILCKLYIEKAYDNVNWGYLLNLLKGMGFGARWLKWIQFCISTVKFSILVNGTPEGFFQSERGLRQGDPLSPFLFIIAMEGLNQMLKVATQNSWLKGFKILGRAGNLVEVSHILYADDTLILCEAKEEQLRYLRIILNVFEAVSGLHVNWGKSRMYAVNEVGNFPILAGILGCQME